MFTCCACGKIIEMDKLITDYEFQLVEPGCTPGAAHYGVQVVLPGDISAVFPYLNAILDDTWYDHENRILIGGENGQKYAFRAYEIRVAGVTNQLQAQRTVSEVVDKVNRVWQERNSITPCFAERRLPTVIDIYQLLPRTNCKKCDYTTCLAYAADLRNGITQLEHCLPLSQSSYAKNKDHLLNLLSSG